MKTKLISYSQAPPFSGIPLDLLDLVGLSDKKVIQIIKTIKKQMKNL